MEENHVIEQASLGILCEKVIEAGWMALVVVVPLFLNVYSYRSFEPDKIALLRSIVLAMAVAWIIKMLETGNWRLEVGSWKLALRTPLVFPALLLAIVYTFTTIASVEPRLSLWGSYPRMQGAYTALSYMAVFFLVLHTLRKREQIYRLITVVLLTSLPISLYGIMQHYGLDAMAWANIGDPVTVRAISTMGNPIFVAAYLIMIVPLTVGRLMQLYFIIRRGQRATSLYVLSGCYAFLLAIQLLCLLFTQSRGPLLGLMGGAFFFILLLAASRGAKRLALGLLGIAALLGLFLMALNLPGSPFESIREIPYLGRLGGILDLESRTARQRTLAWEGTDNLLAANPRRALIGYGLETMIVTLNPYLPPALFSLKPDETFDRSHNETLDVLATTGLIGLAAYLLLFGSLFYYGLKYLGLISSSRHRRLFVLLCSVGGVAGGLLPWALEGEWRFAGVGIPAGMLLALVTYLMTTFKAQSSKSKVQPFDQAQGRPPTSKLQLLLIALLSAIVAHFIETQLGISVVATRTYFWVYAALAIAIGSCLQRDPSTNAQPRSRQGGGTQAASIVFYSLVVGLILATIGFTLIVSQASSPGQVLALLGFFIAVWLICGTMAIIEAREGIASLADSVRRAPFLVSLGWFVAFLIVHMFARLVDGAIALIFYYLYLFLTIAVVAAVLVKTVSVHIRFRPGIRWWPYPLLILGAVALIIVTNVTPIVADIRYKQGLSHANSGRWDESIALFQQAVELAPGQDFYYLFLAGAWVEKARSVSDITQRPAWLEEAENALERGRQISPLNANHVSKLGLLYRVWGEMLTDPQEKAEKFDQALEYYRQAEALSPQDPSIFNQWGRVHFAKGEYDQAVDKYRKSLSLNDRSIQAYLLLGDTYRASGDFDQALEAYERAIDLDPDDFTGHRSMALLYQQMGRIEAAIAEAAIAKDLAPSTEAVALQELLIHLQAQRR